MPLYTTVAKCRLPKLRREALALLRQAPQVQGFFKCAPWATLAEKVIQLEEDHVPSVRVKALSYGTNVDHAMSVHGNRHSGESREIFVFGVLMDAPPRCT
ncbi:uncharacterized protein BDW43DRAFT_294630 [Aspergillus alliaceus]|uniref:uncharacterized protein n=1 Tax=Petromyces alliaceus TaxID=209559 RepID=UPI0012A756F7|nr:uncharacterized protein BDW43DRAFT_294630 [Aspergillus alliaceus]KAB8227218.1 hypothetical protein BDW43DRAFT_294630 [Aspergillus alliaceus]